MVARTRLRLSAYCVESRVEAVEDVEYVEIREFSRTRACSPTQPLTLSHDGPLLPPVQCGAGFPVYRHSRRRPQPLTHSRGQRWCS